MSMNDDEFDMVNKKCNEFLQVDSIGQIVNDEFRNILQRIYLQGYRLGKENKFNWTDVGIDFDETQFAGSEKQ